jgi:hypothetical protein
VSGTGSLETLLDLGGMSDLFLGNIAKGAPGFALAELIADSPQRRFLLSILLTDIVGEAGPERLIDVRANAVNFGALDAEDAIV